MTSVGTMNRSMQSIKLSSIAQDSTSPKEGFLPRNSKVAGMRTIDLLKRVPPKGKKSYYKAITGLMMREEGTLELEDEACREEVKDILRDHEHRQMTQNAKSSNYQNVIHGDSHTVAWDEEQACSSMPSINLNTTG